MSKNKKNIKYGYIDGVNWQHEVGETKDGEHKIYDSPDKLKKNSKCWQQCGIIKIKMELIEWVEPQDFSKIKEDK